MAAVLVLLLAASAFLCRRSSPRPAPPPAAPALPDRARPGLDAPDFALQDAQGRRTVRLADLKGRPVVLVFGSCT